MRIFPGNRPGRWLLLLGLSALLPVAGCGKSAGTVTGTVKLNGVPLKGGQVVLLPADGVGPPASARIGTDGTFTLEKVSIGAKKVMVQTSHLRPKAFGRGGGKPYEKPKDAAAGEGGGGQHDYKPPDLSEDSKNYVAIPARYEDPDQSGLTFEATGGKQDLPIDLKSP